MASSFGMCGRRMGIKSCYLSSLIGACLGAFITAYGCLDVGRFVGTVTFHHAVGLFHFVLVSILCEDQVGSDGFALLIWDGSSGSPISTHAVRLFQFIPVGTL